MLGKNIFATQRFGGGLLFLALFFFSVFYMCTFFYFEEDSYIYFRVAENIAGGFGYVFNRGDQPVESGSGPLWQYILSVGAWAGADPALLSKFLGFVFGIATIATVYFTTRKLTSPSFAGLAAIVLANSVPFVWWASSGMESALFTFLMALCIFVAIGKSGNGWLSAIPYALLLFVRPEAFIFTAIFAVHFWLVNKRSVAVRIMACSAASYGAYLAFRCFYFEDIQISAFYAKISDGQVLWAYLAETLRGLRWHYFVALIIPAALYGFKSKAKAEIYLLLALSCVGLYFAAANFDYKAYFRFFSHALPQFLMLFFLSAHILSTHAPKILRRFIYLYVAAACIAAIWLPRVDHMGEILKNPLYRSMGIIIANPKLAFESYGQKMKYLHQETRLDKLLQPEVSYVAYYNYQAIVGRFLKLNYPKGTVIAYDQMGQTPYFAGSDKKFIDFLGLITKPVSMFMFNQEAQSSLIKRTYKSLVDPLMLITSKSNRNYDIDSAFSYIASKRPDIVMVHTLVATDSRTMTAHVATSQWLKENYTEKYSIATWIKVYERNGSDYPLRYDGSMPTLNFLVISKRAD